MQATYTILVDNKAMILKASRPLEWVSMIDDNG
jgi:hypothetical protein